MRLQVATRLIDVELGERHVVGTGTGDEHVVDRGRQLVEEPAEPVEVGGVEGGDAAVDLEAGTLHTNGVRAVRITLAPSSCARRASPGRCRSSRRSRGRVCPSSRGPRPLTPLTRHQRADGRRATIRSRPGPAGTLGTAARGTPAQRARSAPAIAPGELPGRTSSSAARQVALGLLARASRAPKEVMADETPRATDRVRGPRPAAGRRGRRSQRGPRAEGRGRHRQERAAWRTSTSGPSASASPGPTGVESEMELAYSGLHQLCAPMLDHLERLPEPQRTGAGDGLRTERRPGPDRFLVGLATLTLLADVAEARPARLHRRGRPVARPGVRADPGVRRPPAPRRARRDRVRREDGHR